jgi:hypothetical protein
VDFASVARSTQIDCMLKRERILGVAVGLGAEFARIARRDFGLNAGSQENE